VIGHRLSQTLAPFVFGRLGFPQVDDVSVSGMIAVTAGCLFLLAWFVAPRHGLFASTRQGIRIASRIVAEDLLGQLYRQGERGGGPIPAADMLRPAASILGGGLLSRWALWKHQRHGLIAGSPTGYSLTPAGVAAAREIVRSHRLWESYLDRHFELPADHLHESAHRAEHYLDADLREQLAAELDTPRRDPHGRNIP
jgi:manganese/zinc/iron transport system permease protein